VRRNYATFNPTLALPLPGQFNQRLLLRKISGKWFEARCVHRNGKKLNEYVPTGFPVDQLPELNPEKSTL
jgi:hypothetical protein